MLAKGATVYDILTIAETVFASFTTMVCKATMGGLNEKQQNETTEIV